MSTGVTMNLCWGQRHLQVISGLTLSLLPKPFPVYPIPAGHPWVLNRAAYSSEMLSVPNWSIKAENCLRSSLSTSSSAGLGRTKGTLRDAVFRRRWSLAAFWELRNCPVNRDPKPSVPGQGDSKAQNPTLPPHGFDETILAQEDLPPAEPWDETWTCGQLWGHPLPPSKGSVSDISWESTRAVSRISLEASCRHLQNPKVNSSVLSCPVPAASSPSKTSSSSSLLHGRSSSCNC